MCCLVPSFCLSRFLMIFLITRPGDAMEQQPSVTAPPVEQLALGATSRCVLRLAPETNDSVICYQLPSTVLRYPFHTRVTPHHLINIPPFIPQCILRVLNISQSLVLPVAGSFILSESNPGAPLRSLSSVSSSREH